MSLELTQERSGRTAAGVFDGAPRRRTVTMHAVARDLQRLAGVLAEPITQVRRTALVTHAGFLVEQMRTDADPGTIPVAFSRLRHEARLWSRDPRRRPAMQAAAESAAVLLTPVDDGAHQEEPAPAAGTGARPSVGLRDLPARHPTALAYRYFWLLDGLPADQTDRVTQEYSRPARWVLRNVLSGGYNRRAYLMWVGGGSGPAV